MPVSMLWLVHKRVPVVLLRLLWIVLVLWFEIGISLYQSATCRWPTLHSVPSATKHVLVVADPQILDHRSYPERSPALRYLSQVIVDLNMRRSWRAVAGLGRHPDAVIFLGDMMDNGRADMSLTEYNAYFDRFQSMFRMPGDLPTYYIPGNHDIGLSSTQSLTEARARYKSHFGPLNQVLQLANHSLVLMDSLSVVEENFERATQSEGFGHRPHEHGQTMEFIEHISNELSGSQGTILFTHIPLARPADASCGPLREKGAIRPGGGVNIGYQNMLSSEASNFLLQSLRPALVLSGDDHDACEYMHSGPQHHNTMEVTVKSFSMAMGIRKPGYMLLSLSDRDHSYKLCFMPDQLWIYLSVYLPQLTMTLLLLALSNLLRIRARESGTIYLSSPIETSPGLPTARYFPLDRLDGDGYSHTSSHHKPRTMVPLSMSTLRRVLGFLTPSSSASSRATKNVISRSFVSGWLSDIWNVAVIPLCIFVGAAWYAFTF